MKRTRKRDQIGAKIRWNKGLTETKLASTTVMAGNWNRDNRRTPQQQHRKSSKEKEEVSTRFHHHRPGNHRDDRPWRPARPASTLNREGLSSSQTCDPETLAWISDRRREQRDHGWLDLRAPSATRGQPCPAYFNCRQRRKQHQAMASPKPETLVHNPTKLTHLAH